MWGVAAYNDELTAHGGRTVTTWRYASSAQLWVLGLVLVAVGAVLWVAGALGNEVGGRRHYW